MYRLNIEKTVTEKDCEVKVNTNMKQRRGKNEAGTKKGWCEDKTKSKQSRGEDKARRIEDEEQNMQG